jgi:hypothetical protein
MKIVVILLGYIKWHYTKGLKSFLNIWKNFFVFLFNYFSIRQLINNIFDPWKRMTDPYPKRFSFKLYLFAFIVNSIMRILGFILRLAILLVGLLVILAFVISLPFLIIIWLLLPLIILVLFVSGLYLIFK